MASSWILSVANRVHKCDSDLLIFLQAIGEFVLTDPNMRVKEKGVIYSVNEGYESSWDQGIRDYVRSRKYPGVSIGFRETNSDRAFRTAEWKTLWSSLHRYVCISY